MAGSVARAGAEAFESAEPGQDYFDGIYWAVTTMTTVGYGDELPTTTEAKVVAMALMVVGIGFAALVTGALAERFVERGREEEAEALGPVADDELAAHVDRLTVAARDLVAELDALRSAVAARAPSGERGRNLVGAGFAPGICALAPTGGVRLLAAGAAAGARCPGAHVGGCDRRREVVQPDVLMTPSAAQLTAVLSPVMPADGGCDAAWGDPVPWPDATSCRTSIGRPAVLKIGGTDGSTVMSTGSERM